MGDDLTDASVTDDSLLRRVADQDEEALGILYDRYSGFAFALAYKVLDDRGQAEDVVQEAFLSVWRRAKSFDHRRGSARSWLLSIVHHAAIDRRRGRFRHEREEMNIEDYAYRLSEDTVWDDVTRRLDQARVRSALAQLPDEQRIVLELAYFGGLTQSEIATRTGEALGTVKSRARLGLRRLNGLLRNTNQDETDQHEQQT